jgi:hypothetical protein
VDLELDSRGAGFAWVFEASPARTDRAEQGFGRFTGEGRWTATPAGDGALDIQIELEPSALSEVTQFLAGRDLGLQGRLASRVRLGGSPQSLQLTGNIELAGLDRPALFGLRQPELGLPIEGSLDVQKQSLQVRTAVAKPDQSAPFAIEFNAVRLFSQPDWTTQAQFDGLPAPTFLDLARKLGSRVPAGLGVEGKLSGKVLLAASSGLDGELTLRQGSVRLGAAGPLSIPEALVRLSGAQVELEECAVATLAGNQAKVRGVWSADSESLDFHAETEQLDMEELTAAMSSLPGVPPLPLLGECEKGSVAGAIEFHRGLPEDEAAGQWLGELQLKGLACPVPGATRPLILQRADLSFRKGGWLVRRAQGDWAGLPFTGEASSQPAARRSFRFSLQMPDARWEQLEALLEPALRRRRSLLERTLPFRRSSPPSWLAGRHAEGRFEFGSLQVGETVWNSVKGSLFWDGSQFEIPHLSASAREARLEGRLQLSLAADQPVYRLLGNLTNWPWLGGAIDADLDLLARGFGPALGAGLRVSGNFHALRSAIPDLPLRSFDGAYDFDAARRPSPLKLSALRAETASGETLTGAASSGDGQLILELAAPNRAPRRLPLPLLSLFPSGESPPAR